MAIPFPSDAWIKELGRLLNDSPSYERSARNWEGDFAFIVEPDEAWDDTSYLFLGLWHGKSTDARMDGQDVGSAEFLIRAPFSTWRQVIEGKLEPIQGMMMRRRRLEGDVRKILRYPRAAKEIVSCCALIPTAWP